MEDAKSTEGIVYVLGNPAFNGYNSDGKIVLKIGMTTRSLEERMNELYNTSVPCQFDYIYAGHMQRAKDFESSLHQIFKPWRINKSREFFLVYPQSVIDCFGFVSHEKVILKEPDDDDFFYDHGDIDF